MHLAIDIYLCYFRGNFLMGIREDIMQVAEHKRRGRHSFPGLSGQEGVLERKPKTPVWLGRRLTPEPLWSY